MESRSVHVAADLQDADPQGADTRVADTRRKQELLAKLYRESPETRLLAPNIRQQHISLFALNLYNSYKIEPRETKKTRSGLIITERTLSYLSFNFNRQGLFDFVKNMDEPFKCWAPVVYDEWQMNLPDGSPGRWLILPVLYGFLQLRPTASRSDTTPNQDRSYQPSTIRSVIIGLEAMGVVKKRNACLRVNPKSRTKVIRITDKGLWLLGEMSK